MSRKIKTRGTLILTVTVIAVLGTCSYQFSKSSDGTSPKQPQNIEPSRFAMYAHPAFAYAQQSTGGKTVSLADIAEKSMPGVVNISSTKTIRQRRTPYDLPFFNDPFFRQFFGEPSPEEMPRERRMQSLGSGVIISKDGLILTNNHVVADMDKILVTLSNREEYQAKVVGKDTKSDMAVLRLQGKPNNLHSLPFGDSHRMRVGDVVLAIGNPFGVGQTVTMGIVSAKGRANMGIVAYEDFIQTDAAINPGNSGGALVNMAGQLIGINTAILSRSGGYMGIGFAIPADMARPIMESLLKHGKVIRGWLGVAIQDLTPELAKAMGIKSTNGVLISDVTGGGPAAKAGMKRGDVVVKVDGTAIDSTGHLRNIVAARGPGATITIDLLRSGKPMTIKVKLGEMPASLGLQGQVGEDEGVLGGITVVDLSPAVRARLRLPSAIRYGVAISAIEPNSPAANAGLQTGDVIMEINRTPVDSVEKFNSLYQSTKGKVLLLVYRNGTTIYLLLSK